MGVFVFEVDVGQTGCKVDECGSMGPRKDGSGKPAASGGERHSVLCTLFNHLTLLPTTTIAATYRPRLTTAIPKHHGSHSHSLQYRSSPLLIRIPASAARSLRRPTHA